MGGVTKADLLCPSLSWLFDPQLGRGPNGCPSSVTAFITSQSDAGARLPAPGKRVPQTVPCWFFIRNGEEVTLLRPAPRCYPGPTGIMLNIIVVNIIDVGSGQPLMWLMPLLTGGSKWICVWAIQLMAVLPQPDTQ